jgi:hypothetical protein
MVGSKEKTLVKEERWLEAIPAAVPPLIFTGSASVLWFCLSPPPSCGDA